MPSFPFVPFPFVLVLLAASLLSPAGRAQVAASDSLLRRLPADTARVNALLEAARERTARNDTTGLSYARASLALATKLQFGAGVARAHLALGKHYAGRRRTESALRHYGLARQQFARLRQPAGVATAQRLAGIACMRNAQYPEAVQAFTEALAFYRRTGNRAEAAGCLLNLGICREQLGQLSEALSCFFGALRTDEALGDTNNIASDYDQIAIIYKKQGHYGKAETFAQKAVALYGQTGNTAGQAATLINLGILYKSTKAYAKALDAYGRAGALFARAADPAGQAATLSNLGELYLQQGRHGLALDHFRRSLALSESIGWKEAILSSLEGLANVYTARRNTGPALGHAGRGIVLAEQIRSPEYRYKFNKLLAVNHKAAGNYPKALEYLEKSVQAHDSLYSLEKSRQIEELQVRYETEKKEQQIALLQKDRALQASELGRKTLWQYGLGCLLLGLGLLGGVLFRTYRVRQQAKRQVLSGQLRVQQLEANQLAEVNALKSRFFSNIAHEFRTPLTLILGPLENLLAGSRAGSREHALLQLAGTHSARLLALVNQLLDLSRLEAGVVRLDPRRGDIMPFLKGTTYSFLSLAEQKDIALGFTAGNEALVMDYDPDKLEKVMNNLLSNAFKFTPAAGRVHVSAGEVADPSPHLRVSVQDSGVGIPAEQLPRVFDRFYQAGNQPGGGTAGSGIGLALAKELVEMHGGTLSVEPNPERGTTFTFTLPISRQAPAESPRPTQPATVPALPAGVELPAGLELAATSELAAADRPPLPAGDPAEPAAPPAGPEAETVLVIEDNAEVRFFIRQSLEDHYHVVEAVNGAEGVRMAVELVPDLILSDVMMPEMDGYQACRALKSRDETSHIPVILLTAKAGTESKLEGLDTGADDYLAKPFHTAELKLRIRNLVRLRKHLQRKYRSHLAEPAPADEPLAPRPSTAEPPGTEEPAPLPARENAFLARLREVVEAHLDDEEFSIEELSREVGMSRTQVHRKLKALTNQSASLFIRTLRLQKARQLLLSGAHNVSEAAYLTGFNSPAYFSTCFAEHYGYPPSELKVRDRQV
jgi:signal transduction histidine kinase/DNA-binding response OmpR family regulator